MPEELDNLSIEDLLKRFEFHIAAVARHQCIYQDDTRFWASLKAKSEEVEKFRQAILTRFAKMEVASKESGK